MVGVRVVAAGDPARSILHPGMESREPSPQMLPLARGKPDAEAPAVLRSWIETLPPYPFLAAVAVTRSPRPFPSGAPRPRRKSQAVEHVPSRCWVRLGRLYRDNLGPTRRA